MNHSQDVRQVAETTGSDASDQVVEVQPFRDPTETRIKVLLAIAGAILVSVFVIRSFNITTPDIGDFTVEVTEANFEELSSSGKPMVLDFGAAWCGPCRQLAPTLEIVAQEFDGQVVVGKVDVDKYQILARKFDVGSIPYLVFIKDEKVVSDSVGVVSQEQITRRVKALLTD